MGVWECRQVIDFDQSTTTVKEERNKNYSLDESDKSIVYKSYTQIGIPFLYAPRVFWKMVAYIRMLHQNKLEYSGFISFIAKKIPQYWQ